MIQRIQTIYLFLLGIFSFAVLWMPFQVNRDGQVQSLIDFPLISIFSILIGGCSILTIFLFFKRTIQIKLIWAMLALCFLEGYMLFNNYLIAQNYKTGFFRYIFIVPILQFILLILSQWKIYQDERLVKDSDRLR
ncbi:MAG: DUF4293 family protein [Chitinophagales bacterium]|nr:DUF4293 family protein [Chitinophagales bacterium]